MSEQTMTNEEFAAICSECGLEVETTEFRPGMIDVVGYISSPVLRDGRTSFCWWNNYVLSGGSVFQGFYDALWRDSNGKYTINGTDLGDCYTFIDSVEQLREVCLNVIDALKRLESDKDYRPKMIDLNRGKYEREKD